MVYRDYVEKKAGQTHEADGLMREIREFLQIQGLTSVRVLNRYDAENLEEESIEESEDSNSNEENVVTTEKKDKISDVEFVKIRFCGCCGKYYDSEGNEVDLLR